MKRHRTRSKQQDDDSSLLPNRLHKQAEKVARTVCFGESKIAEDWREALGFERSLGFDRNGNKVPLWKNEATFVSEDDGNNNAQVSSNIFDSNNNNKLEAIHEAANSFQFTKKIHRSGIEIDHSQINVRPRSDAIIITNSPLPPPCHDAKNLLAFARRFFHRRAPFQGGAVTECSRKCRPTIAILSDSQSLLAALKSGPFINHDPILAEIWNGLIKLCKIARIKMQHVRSHCGIEGNELVDREADEAAELNQQDVPLQYRDICAAAKEILRGERSQHCAAINTKRKELLGHEKYEKLKSTTFLPRQVERTLAQLRIGFENAIGSLHRVLNTYGIGKKKIHTRHDSCRWCCGHIHEAFNNYRLREEEKHTDAVQQMINTRKEQVNTRFRNSANIKCPDCKVTLHDRRRIHHHLSCFNVNYTPRYVKFGQKYVVDDHGIPVLHNECPKNKLRTEQQILHLVNLVPRGEIFKKFDAAEKFWNENHQLPPNVKTITRSQLGDILSKLKEATTIKKSARALQKQAELEALMHDLEVKYATQETEVRQSTATKIIRQSRQQQPVEKSQRRENKLLPAKIRKDDEDAQERTKMSKAVDEMDKQELQVIVNEKWKQGRPTARAVLLRTLAQDRLKELRKETDAMIESLQDKMMEFKSERNSTKKRTRKSTTTNNTNSPSSTAASNGTTTNQTTSPISQGIDKSDSDEGEVDDSITEDIKTDFSNPEVVLEKAFLKATMSSIATNETQQQQLVHKLAVALTLALDAALREEDFNSLNCKDSLQLLIQGLSQHCLETALSNIKCCFSNRVHSVAERSLKLDDLPLDLIFRSCTADARRFSNKTFFSIDHAKKFCKLKLLSTTTNNNSKNNEKSTNNNNNNTSQIMTATSCLYAHLLSVLSDCKSTTQVMDQKSKSPGYSIASEINRSLDEGNCNKSSKEVIFKQSQELLQRQVEKNNNRRKARQNSGPGILGPALTVPQATLTGGLKILGNSKDLHSTAAATGIGTSLPPLSQLSSNNNESYNNAHQQQQSENTKSEIQEQREDLPHTFPCPHCGKDLPSKRGLSIHIGKLHKAQKPQEDSNTTSTKSSTCNQPSSQPQHDDANNNNNSLYNNNTEEVNNQNNNNNNNIYNSSSFVQSSRNNNYDDDEISETDTEILLANLEYQEELGNTSTNLTSTTDYQNDDDQQQQYYAPIMLLDDDDDNLHLHSTTLEASSESNTQQQQQQQQIVEAKNVYYGIGPYVDEDDENAEFPQDIGEKETIPHVLLFCPAIAELRAKYGIIGTLAQKQQAIDRLLHIRRGYEFYLEILSQIGASPLLEITSTFGDTMAEGPDGIANSNDEIRTNNNTISDNLDSHGKKSTNSLNQENVTTRTENETDPTSTNDESTGTTRTIQRSLSEKQEILRQIREQPREQSLAVIRGRRSLEREEGDGTLAGLDMGGFVSSSDPSDGNGTTGPMTASAVSVGI
jgi:transcription elongation factor Elf1